MTALSPHTVLIHQVFASANEPGGTRHLELARHVVRRGQRFTIVASNLNYISGQRIGTSSNWISEDNIDGIRLIRCYTYPSIHRNYVWRVLSFLSFMVSSTAGALRADSVDLVMGTSPPIFQAVSAWAVSVLRRRPLLLEIRDLWPEFAIDVGVLRNPALISLSRWLEVFLYRHATHLLVNSPAYVNYLISKNVAPSKISLIANGVDPNMFNPQDRGENVRRRFGLESKFVWTYAGALGLANDIDTLLHAAAHLRDEDDIHLLLVGGGKEMDRLQELARSLDLPNVTFAGPQPKSEVAAFLAASDACVAILKNIPMFRTTYPNKVFDYMAAGRPILLAIDGVIREVVESAQAGIFVPPGSDTALADAVRKLRCDAATAQAMGASARKYVLEHFNRVQQAEEFASLLARVAGGRQA